MAWTYSGDPGASTRDAVRFLIGDTDSTDQQLADAEIDYLVTYRGDAYRAAIAACHRLEAKYARYAGKAVGDLRLQYKERVENYHALARTIQLEGGVGGIVPYAGGISESDKETDEQDTDRVAPSFTRELGDFYGTQSSGYLDEEE